MPDRISHATTRKSARIALLVSVLLHVGLFIVLIFSHVSTPVHPPPLQESELVVFVEDSASRKGNSSSDVTPPQVELPARLEAVAVPMLKPIPQIVSPQLVENRVPAPEAASLNPGVPSAIRQVGGEGTSENGTGPSLFQTTATGRSVVYVLDRSMSMGWHDGLQQARTELAASLARLPADTPFQVIAYNDVAEPLSVGRYAGLLTADAETIAAVNQAVAGLRAVGGTRQLQALEHGLQLGTEIIFLITDGEDPNFNAEAVNKLTLSNRGRCAIHVIVLSNRLDEGNHALRRLAAENRGTYRRVAVREL